MRPGSPAVPCNGLIPGSFYCHAVREPDCRKLLVIVGDGPAPVSGRTLGDLPNDAQQWIGIWRATPSGTFCRYCASGAVVNQSLPLELRFKHVAFWRANAGSEVLPGVFQRAGLAPEDYRIFISYIRRETAELAEQLHEALTREGFAVFVDRFSVPVVWIFKSDSCRSLPIAAWCFCFTRGAWKFTVGRRRDRHCDQIPPWADMCPALARRARTRQSLPDRSRPINAAEWDRSEDKLTDAALTTVVQEIKRVHHDARPTSASAARQCARRCCKRPCQRRTWLHTEGGSGRSLYYPSTQWDDKSGRGAPSLDSPAAGTA